VQERAFAHAKQIDALFAIVFPVVYPLGREWISNRPRGAFERNAVAAPVDVCFLSAPLKLPFRAVLITSTKVKRSR
jgi:hypothetical protein